MHSEEDFLIKIKRSVMGIAWQHAVDVSKYEKVSFYQQVYGVAPQLASILVARDADEINEYLNPTLRYYMPDPKLFIDMDKAAQRIVNAIKKKEKIAIFGDYDVDGACSCAILANFFKFYKIPYEIYIPDRLVEGYGPNSEALKKLIANGASLIITVDCGANSKDILREIKDSGVDIVVLDHHQMTDLHEEDYALVNPNRLDDLTGQEHLCAAGVVFMALVRMIRFLKEDNYQTPDPLQFLDLVAFATICDVVPLKGVNRAFIVKGLQIANKAYNKGLRALIKSANFQEPLKPFHFGYILGPRINAGGRIGDQALGARLLTCDCPQEAFQIAEILTKLNQERQLMEATQLEQAEAMLMPYAIKDVPSSIVLGSEEWHPGIIGLIASRLKEKYYRPAFAIAIKQDGFGIGSGRSIEGIDLGKLIHLAVTKGLLVKGGGHAMAAGFTIKKENIKSFQQWIEKELEEKIKILEQNRCIKIDGIISASTATIGFCKSLEMAGPYGAGNTEPIFALLNHEVAFLREVGKGHLSLSLSNQSGDRIKAIAFRVKESPLWEFFHDNIGRPVHIAGHLNLNYWQGNAIPQLRIIDAAPIL